MSQDFGVPTPITPMEQPKKSNTTMIIVIVVVVVILCCCCPTIGYGIWWLWNNGDQFIGTSLPLLSLLI